LRQYPLDGRPVQGRRAFVVARGAVSAGTSSSETFSGTCTSAGWTERGGAVLPAAGGGHGSEGLGLSLWARRVVRRERECIRCAGGVSAGVATEPGQQGSAATADGAGGEVKKEMETPAKAGMRIDSALSVEIIRVREQGPESVAAASESELALVTAAQGWVVRLMVLGAVLTVAGLYVVVHIGRGWVPADDGTLSQSALRVLQGQLPHRDFGEIYTGGLSFIHALAFRAFGVNLMSLRICVFLFFLAWLPAVYYVALRFASAIGAGAITLLAVAWSYPNYPAAMPSWYNLFFATFGAAALLRYLEVRTRRWLFVAGVCGGVSILIKVIGAYYIAGALLFLAFLEQSENSRESSERSSTKSLADEYSQNSWPYRVFSVSALLLFLATLVLVLHSRLGMAELFHFLLPSAVLVGLILRREQSVRV